MAWAKSLTVLDCGTSGGRPLGEQVLITLTDRPSIQACARLLRIVEDPDAFGYCMCFGGPALVFQTPDGAVVLGLHHGSSLRWNAWETDAPLADGHALSVWLSERGVFGPLAELEGSEARARTHASALSRWEAAIPACLAPLWGEDRQRAVRSGINPAPERYLDALARAVSEPSERVRTLLRWFGHGVGPWSGFPSYEAFPQELLLTMPICEVVAALEGVDLAADLHLGTGAARYFTSHAVRNHKSRAHRKALRAVPAEFLAKLHHFARDHLQDHGRAELAERHFSGRRPSVTGHASG